MLDLYIADVGVLVAYLLGIIFIRAGTACLIGNTGDFFMRRTFDEESLC